MAIGDRPLRVLLVEDSEYDAELVQESLRGGGLIVEARIVATASEFRSALESFTPDLILSDWAMPGFSGAEAVSLARAWDPSVPCILVSGTLGEEIVVQALRTGATDYVLKQRLETLVPAVRRALAEAAEHRERARLEGELAASQASMRASLDTMRDAFVICSSVRDEAGAMTGFRVDFANRAASAFMGAGPESLVGALMPGAIPDLLGRRFVDACREVVETGIPLTADAVELVFPGPAGGRSWVLDIQIARSGNGFFAAWRDVIEREQLARDREGLATIVEQSPDGIVVTDTQTQITYANAAFLAAFGRELPDLIGQALPAVLTSVVDPAMIAVVGQSVSQGIPWHGEIEHHLPAGSRRIDLSIAPSHDPKGAIASWVQTLRDVTQLREAEAELLLQERVRAALVEALHAIPAEAGLEEAAQAICDQIVTLSIVDVAVIQIFLGGDDVQVLAQSAPPGYPPMAGTHLPPARAATVLAEAAVGPWARYAASDLADGGLRAAAVEGGLKALAYGPIAHGDTVVGTLVLGTFDERFARTVVEQMPGIVSFGVTSSALLAERMYRRRQTAEKQAGITGVLATCAFHPVFQPIVDLETRDVVGYEALTRFDSGQRPDRCFADAWSVGLGAEMELATLAAAVEASRRLPPGVWLDLNVSPRLLAEPERLRPILWDADRPIVLEVTEHEVIEDYDAVRASIQALGHDMRVAVDDAGAGIANFGHIIDLRPDFVKLDFSLVRRVNLNLGRQALVVGMRHFSRTAGCRLIAEGVETIEEAATLTNLGVEFGQGYLFGRPELVGAWVGADPDSPARPFERAPSQ
jgi:PAS domain S-box-containing protein